MNTKITAITVSRTISMANYSNEKQEVIVEVQHGPEDKISDITRKAYETAEKAFCSMLPQYGGVNEAYVNYIKGKITFFSQQQQQQQPEPKAKLPFGGGNTTQMPDPRLTNHLESPNLANVGQPANPTIEKVELEITSGVDNTKPKAF